MRRRERRRERKPPRIQHNSRKEKSTIDVFHDISITSIVAGNSAGGLAESIKRMTVA